MGAELDPGLSAFLRQINEANAPAITAGTPDEARAANAAFLEAMRTALVEVASIEPTTIPARGGALEARVYTPHGPVTSVVGYFHGGGWVLGDLEGHDQLCRQVADTAGSIVVNVNYRHAPEFPFPAASEDATAALAWIAETYPDLPLVAMGDSSGGNLAASASIASRDAGVAVALQVLLYPVLDADLDSGSFQRNGEGYLLTRSDMDWFWTQYVPAGADRFDPRASPLRVETVEGLSPAIIVVAGFDPLYDEAVAYARRLARAGIGCQLLDYPSMLHGFMTLPALTPSAEEATDTTAKAIRSFIESGSLA